MEWIRNGRMLSFKRTNFAAAVVALSLALFAGCKSSQTKTPPAPPKPSPPVETVQPQPVPWMPARSPSDSGDSMASNILAWDALAKVYVARAGESKAPFTFNLTNVSSSPVVIYDTSTTCDCTVAELPHKPWTIPSGGTGAIDATIDLGGKTGTVTNSIVVFTSRGNRRLWVRADIAN